MTESQQRWAQQIFIVLGLLAVSAATGAAVLKEEMPPSFAFEARLASFEEVEGWETAPGPTSDQTLWLSPEATLTNAHVSTAWYEPRGEEHAIGLLLTEEGALRLARATRTHIGEPMALMIDGVVTAAPLIMAAIEGGRASIHGNFTEEEARAIAAGIAGE
jgi:preprotein translocase subunit SecD